MIHEDVDSSCAVCLSAQAFQFLKPDHSAVRLWTDHKSLCSHACSCIVSGLQGYKGIARVLEKGLC